MADRRAGDRTRVLFLCTHNSARSQMAEGLLRGMAEDRFEVFSAGTEATRVRPEAISVMAEIGVDISAQDESWTATSEKPPDPHRLRRRERGLPGLPGSERAPALVLPRPFEAAGGREERLRAFRDADEIRARIQGELAEQDV